MCLRPLQHGTGMASPCPAGMCPPQMHLFRSQPGPCTKTSTEWGERASEPFPWSLQVPTTLSSPSQRWCFKIAHRAGHLGVVCSQSGPQVDGKALVAPEAASPGAQSGEIRKSLPTAAPGCHPPGARSAGSLLSSWLESSGFEDREIDVQRAKKQEACGGPCSTQVPVFKPLSGHGGAAGAPGPWDSLEPVKIYFS